MGLNTYAEQERNNRKRMEKRIKEKLEFSVDRYDENARKDFLNFINKIQDNTEEVYIKPYNKSNDPGKAPNNQLIEYLKNINFETEIHNFLNSMYTQKINSDSWNLNRFLSPFPYKVKVEMDLDKITELEGLSPIPKITEIMRGFIRENIFPNALNRIESLNPKYIENELYLLPENMIASKISKGKSIVEYKWKIDFLKLFLERNFSFLNIENTHEFHFLEKLSFTRDYIKISTEIITQLIVYDLLHERFSTEEREIKSKKINESLDILLDDLQESPHKYDDIYKDFFSYIYLNYDLSLMKMQEEIQKLVIKESEITKKIVNNELTKEEILKYYLDNKENSDGFFALNFMDVPEIKKLEKENDNFNLLWSKLEETHNFKNALKKNKKELAKILFLTEKQKNNYDKDLEILKFLLEGIPTLGKNNLQALKVTANEIYLSKITTKNRKKLISEVKEAFENRENEKVVGFFFDLEINRIIKVNRDISLNTFGIIREKITRGMYREKGIEKEYETFHEIYSKIVKLFKDAISKGDADSIMKASRKIVNTLLEIIIIINKNERIALIGKK